MTNPTETNTFPHSTGTEDLRTLVGHANGVLRHAMLTENGVRRPATSEELAMVERVGLRALGELDERGEAARTDVTWLRAPGT